MPKEKGYAIKFLTVSKKNVKEVEKRKIRFEKEIRQVITLQNSVEGIISIYDASIYSEDSQKKFVVPYANETKVPVPGKNVPGKKTKRLKIVQLVSQIPFKGDWGCFLNKQFAKIGPEGKSRK